MKHLKKKKPNIGVLTQLSNNTFSMYTNDKQRQSLLESPEGWNGLLLL